MTTLYVALGGTAGVLARYGGGRTSADPLRSIVAINVVGSFLLGLLVASDWFSRDLREAVGVGFLGGFTIFSTFSVHVVTEVDQGEPRTAFLYVVASVAGGVLAAWAGYGLGRTSAV